ncbi:cytochrome o ubiquinol oxidase subunit IV [Mesorhizobium sp. B2-1-8]|uniref:cytochrome o ubiquinol oxidase subunit IV n=1 Tax=unclassified Mesorhizobium TaxID=325217 RepID=UPI001129E674|nr:MULTISPECIES: cytochrome o ubiquinol oxidase subunit IV [unclassified Mesorhizobium]MBZ9673200.1 cytochrome o ubiquinol oxidase subunit IV [Mesorhizobium sp. ES1-3]UCI18318.1 cytochrome o ubiquinol oxidase subunit IV [Mesorhizobium sp. B2-1-8]
MTDETVSSDASRDTRDTAPGEETIARNEPAAGLPGYLLGYGLAALLTVGSFIAARTELIYQPAVISALVVLALAQIGVHLVFFLHLTSGPDNTNNILALAFGVLIVALIVLGSIWIMGHLDQNMAPMKSQQLALLPLCSAVRLRLASAMARPAG